MKRHDYLQNYRMETQVRKPRSKTERWSATNRFLPRRHRKMLMQRECSPSSSFRFLSDTPAERGEWTPRFHMTSAPLLAAGRILSHSFSLVKGRIPMKNLKSSWFAIACIMVSLSSPAWAATNLPFGQTTTGSIGSVAQTNSYTFSANANDVVDFHHGRYERQSQPEDPALQPQL